MDTYGYMTLEYEMSRIVIKKFNVFLFDMALLEVACINKLYMLIDGNMSNDEMI